MSEIFSSKQRYELWLRIELTVCEGWAELGEIPRSVLERLRQARVDPEHIARLEERVGHDVVAFLDSLADSVGGEDARYLHRGLTSSDVLDRSEEHTSELQSRLHLVCRLLLEKKKTQTRQCSLQSEC